MSAADKPDASGRTIADYQNAGALMVLPDGTGLRNVLINWGNPSREFVDKLPKPTRRDNQKGNCRECGGYHGLPAVHLDYMGHAAVTRALIEVDPHWSWEPVAFNEDGEPMVKNAGGHLRLWGRLTVLGKSLICVGTCDAGKPEPEKELIGDLLRNGAMRFGIGLGLWAKDEWNDLGASVPAVSESADGGGVSGTAAGDPATGPPDIPCTKETWDAVLRKIQVELNEEQVEQLQAWAHERRWKVTRRSLLESQAQQVLAWLPAEVPGQQTIDGGEVA